MPHWGSGSVPWDVHTEFTEKEGPDVEIDENGEGEEVDRGLRYRRGDLEPGLSAQRDRSEQEVRRLHEVIEAWLRGETDDLTPLSEALAREFEPISPDGPISDREAVLTGSCEGHGNDSELTIAIGDIEHRTIAGEWHLVRYEEHHSTDGESTGRISTGALRERADAPAGLSGFARRRRGCPGTEVPILLFRRLRRHRARRRGDEERLCSPFLSPLAPLARTLRPRGALHTALLRGETVLRATTTRWPASDRWYVLRTTGPHRRHRRRRQWR